MQVYYAAPLFTDAERAWNLANAQALRAGIPGLRLLLPQEFCSKHDQAKSADAGPDFTAIFRDCRDHLDQADLVLAVLDGADPDSGTCWEVGYAYAKQTPIIGLRTDWRPGEDAGANCMLTQSCESVHKNITDVIADLQQRIS